jgi:hypothetical protein|tara:strand:+ start:1139 stop:1309 length:171 start_codon:yes stop_codon:yes gene_type:complete
MNKKEFSKVLELTQAKDMLEIKQKELEQQIEELKADKRNLQQQVLLLQLVTGAKNG